jgi:hypothetical protein
MANGTLGSQKEDDQDQDSCGSGGGLMKNLLVKGGGGLCPNRRDQ